MIGWRMLPHGTSETERRPDPTGAEGAGRDRAGGEAPAQQGVDPPEIAEQLGVTTRTVYRPLSRGAA